MKAWLAENPWVTMYFRSALTCSMMAWARWVLSAVMVSRVLVMKKAWSWGGDDADQDVQAAHSGVSVTGSLSLVAVDFLDGASISTTA